MLTDYQKKKATTTFYQFDANNNGTLDYGDFTAHAHFIKEKKGWADDYPQFIRLMEAKREAWHELHAHIDANNDDLLTLDEWLAFCDNINSKTETNGKPPAWLTRIHYLIFQSIDLDGDGKIGPQEYGLYLKSIRVEDGIEEAFQRVDANGDGVIDLEEVEDLWTQWILSNDPSDPGNYFMTGMV